MNAPPRPPGSGRRSHRRHLQHLPEVLDVVAVVSNPYRFRSRYDLYRSFARHMAHAGVRLTTVECAFGSRPFEVTNSGNPRHVRVRTDHVLWLKENLINIGVARLPYDWKYVAWIDADITFARPDWVQETLHELQVHPVVQLFGEAHDLGPHHECFATHKGFVKCYRDRVPPGANYAAWHPGFAWAAVRWAWEALGGLIDWAILGAGDHHMAKGLIGRIHENVAPGISPAYHRRLEDWQARAEGSIRRDVGYVPGAIFHAWHGQKINRRYWDRWKILVENGFDPDLDLRRGRNGLWELTDRSIGLRDGIRHYFRQRDEDNNSLD